MSFSVHPSSCNSSNPIVARVPGVLSCVLVHEPTDLLHGGPGALEGAGAGLRPTNLLLLDLFCSIYQIRGLRSAARYNLPSMRPFDWPKQPHSPFWRNMVQLELAFLEHLHLYAVFLLWRKLHLILAFLEAKISTPTQPEPTQSSPIPNPNP